MKHLKITLETNTSASQYEVDLAVIKSVNQLLGQQSLYMIRAIFLQCVDSIHYKHLFNIYPGLHTLLT